MDRLLPFTLDNCSGYTQAEMDALNEEFEKRWNGWEVEDETRLFCYANGEHMSEEDAIKQFQTEVAQR